MQNRKAALVCCSNALPHEKEAVVRKLEQILPEYGIETVRSRCMFSDFPWGHGTGRDRAEALMDVYRDKSITEIYDLSGGELCNELLPYLDYDVIRANYKPFYGYSDLTVMLNAVYEKTGREGVLYQVRNLVQDTTGGQQERFDTHAMSRFPVRFLRGESMEGILVGGNIRCFLKLAGTPYFPELTGKILLLEAFGGLAVQMMTYLSQLEQLGAFRKISGVILGTFTKMEREAAVPSMEELVLKMVPDGIPVAKTELIGHGLDSRAAVIGREYRFFGNEC